METQIIQFSTRWNVSEFAKFLSQDCNHVPSSFIISENFSPFYHKLIDAYIELAFDNFNDEQWSGISAYVHFKSYFIKPVPVTFKICFWDGICRMARGKCILNTIKIFILIKKFFIFSFIDYAGKMRPFWI